MMDLQIKQGNKRVEAFDFWKGICMLLVIISHSTWTEKECLKLGFPFSVNMAVPLFMLISGYLNAKSFQEKNVSSLEKAYDQKRLKKIFFRFSVPFLCIWLLEGALHFWLYEFRGIQRYTFMEWLLSVFAGGYGPGSFYYPILIQLICIYPIIYFVINKYEQKGVYGLFLCEILFEVIKIPWKITEDTYRLMIFRYVPLLAFGTYIYLYGKEKLKSVFLWGGGY